MSIPHLPSPALTPVQAPAISLEEQQAIIRKDVELKLLALSQDLWEMEICAGDVGQGMENAVPTYLYAVHVTRNTTLC
jgi:mediator of RNA polymerase II transcription subunit 10